MCPIVDVWPGQTPQIRRLNRLFRKDEARIKGTRDGDSIRGTVELPMGLVTFEGTRG